MNPLSKMFVFLGVVFLMILVVMSILWLAHLAERVSDLENEMHMRKVLDITMDDDGR